MEIVRLFVSYRSNSTDKKIMFFVEVVVFFVCFFPGWNMC